MRGRGLGFRGGMSEDLCGHGKKARWRKDVWRGVSAFMCAFLLFAVFVVPAASHEKLASEDYTLQIYGNANEDDTVDMRDVTYIKLVIFGKKPETEFCDANYDGKVSMLDVVQTKLIIVGKEAKLTIVDSAGRTVTVKKPVKRIIPQQSWSYEPIWVLGAQDKVVGVTSTVRDGGGAWLPGIQDKPIVGTFKELDYEKVIGLEPDIVIAGSKTAEKLEPLGITVISLPFAGGLEMFEPQFKILAKILGKDERASEFISWRRSCIDKIKERTEKLKPEEKIKVYGESNARPWFTAAKNTSFHDVITTAGGINIAGDIPGFYVDVEPEWVVKENPDVIVIAATMSRQIPAPGLDYFADESDIADMKQYLEETYNRTGIRETDAAKNGRIYLIHGYIVEGGCRSFVGIWYCAKWFYPELFEDLNPEEVHREYFEEWIGVPYKGIWAYPLIGG